MTDALSGMFITLQAVLQDEAASDALCEVELLEVIDWCYRQITGLLHRPQSGEAKGLKQIAAAILLSFTPHAL